MTETCHFGKYTFEICMMKKCATRYHQKGASAHFENDAPQKNVPFEKTHQKKVPFEEMNLKKYGRPKEEWLQSILPT